MRESRRDREAMVRGIFQEKGGSGICHEVFGFMPQHQLSDNSQVECLRGVDLSVIQLE